MSFLTSCTACGQPLTLPDGSIGQIVQCVNCELEFTAMPTAAAQSGKEDGPRREQVPVMQTGIAPHDRQPGAPRGTYYCVLCGTRAAPHEEACSNCGCPIQMPRDDEARIQYRPRPRPLQPVRGAYAVFGAMTMPMGVVSYIAAVIVDETLRRSPMRDLLTFFFVLLGIVIQAVGLASCAIWLYQAWRAVTRDDEEYSPGLRIALLFVPFFNLYWIFQVVPGLSKAIHRELRILDPRRASSAGWIPGLIACVTLLIPYAQPVAFFLFVAWMLIANNALQRLIRRHDEWLDDEEEQEERNAADRRR